MESGTSVAPRQRPKANTSGQSAVSGVSLGSALPIMLPPSPSPRTVLSSPVPTTTMGPTPAAAATPQVATAAVTTTTTTVESISQGEEFDAQFTAVFPPTTTTPVVSSGIVSANAISGNLSNNSEGASNGSQKHLNNLFETNYPDPFREQQQRQVLAGDGGGGGGAVVGIEAHSMPFCGTGSGGGGGGGGSGTGTPTKGPLNSLAAHHHHHRRNVSDTSAFNK